MNNNTLCLYIVVMLLIGCTTDGIHQDIYTTNASIQKNNRAIRSIDDAIIVAENAASFFSNVTTRSTSNKQGVSCKNVVPITNSSLTRGDAGGTDTLMYIVNFIDNSGFAIVSASYDTPDLLGISEIGNFSDFDFNSPESFWVYLESLKNYIIDSENDKGHLSDKGLPITPRYTITYEVLNEVNKMIAVCWGQRNIYGEDCPNGIAGCANTAIAQIMSYYSYPQSMVIDYNDSIFNCVFDWSSMRTHIIRDDVVYPRIPACMVADTIHAKITKLCRQLGETAGSYYDANATSTYRYQMEDCLYYYGYANNYFSTYSQTQLVSQLDNLHPVLMTGLTADNLGHAWIVDGYKYFKVTKSYFGGEYPDEISYKYYNHINWGWDGKANGYFLANTFSTSSPLNNQYDYASINTNYAFIQSLKIMAPYPSIN